jgi:carboxyl-terminal processing protease
MKRRWLVTALIGLVAFVSGGWLAQQAPNAEADRLRQARVFERVLNLVRDNYVDTIPEPELYRQAAYGLVDQLDDPYSALFMGEDLTRADERTTGDYGGIGARIDVRNGWITVVSTMPDTPAERAGLQSGDRIAAVEGESTEGWTVDQAVNVLRGEVGTPVSVSLERVGAGQTSNVVLHRARVHQRAVPRGLTMAGDVGYVSMDAVRLNSATELAMEVGRLYADGMTGLVIDLRGNPGGIRDESVLAADLFLDPGSPILITRGRTADDNLEFVDSLPQPWPDLPIVVLVNGGSVSAAEIFAGALQDNDRAVIVGQPTYGKGLVQTQFHIGRDVALRITTARWYTPSGRSIQRASVDIPHGQTPDSAMLPLYFSSAGRELRGGGGIIPDIIVPLDTLTDRERQLAIALDPYIVQYRDALATLASEAKSVGRVTDEDFVVSDEVVADLIAEMVELEVVLPDSIWAGGRELVASHISYEFARYLFGPSAELKRRLKEDGQVREAVELLGRSASQEELFDLAGTPLPSKVQG